MRCWMEFLKTGHVSSKAGRYSICMRSVWMPQTFRTASAFSSDGVFPIGHCINNCAHHATHVAVSTLSGVGSCAKQRAVIAIIMPEISLFSGQLIATTIVCSLSPFGVVFSSSSKTRAHPPYIIFGS